MLLVLLLTTCIVGNAWTQNANAEREAAVGELQRVLQNEISALMFHEEMWEGSGTFFSFPYYAHRGGEEFRHGLGLTKKQIHDIEEIMFRVDLTALAYNTATAALGEQTTLSEEIKSAASASLKVSVPQLLKEIDEVAAENLTPEQSQKFRELNVMALSVFPFAYPPMFEALGLTEDQRMQLSELKKELQPEYERMSKQFIADRIAIRDKFDDAFVEIFQEISREEWRQKPREEREKKENEIRDRLLREDTEYRKAMERIHTQGRDFQNRLKDWFDILTNEQIDRLNRLINNPPDYAKKIMESTKRELGDPKKLRRRTNGNFSIGLGSPAMRFPKAIGNNAKKEDAFRESIRANNQSRNL